MRRETLLLIWIGGFVLAVLLYVIGPDRFLDSLVNAYESIELSFRDFVAAMGAQAYGVIRAAAIALYVVFAVLSFLASQRRHRGVGALIAVSVVFLLLVWRPYSEFPAPIGRWFAALVLVFVGAAIMTQRLLTTPTLRGGGAPPPYTPGRGP